MQAGFELAVYTRTKAKAKELIDAGAVWHDTPSSLAASVDAVITMVGYPSDVREVYFGENGIIHHARPGTYVIDMTTSKPALAEEIHSEAKDKVSSHWMLLFQGEMLVRRTESLPSWSAVKQMHFKLSFQCSKQWAKTSFFKDLLVSDSIRS